MSGVRDPSKGLTISRIGKPIVGQILFVKEDRIGNDVSIGFHRKSNTTFKGRQK